MARLAAILLASTCLLAGAADAVFSSANVTAADGPKTSVTVEEEAQAQATGWCQNPWDQGTWESRGGKSSFAKDAEACGRQTAGARDGVRQCISKLGFTYNCANCYADLVACTISPKCINQCITGSNPACDACARQNCWPNFQGCTGFDVLASGSNNNNTTALEGLRRPLSAVEDFGSSSGSSSSSSANETATAAFSALPAVPSAAAVAAEEAQGQTTGWCQNPWDQGTWDSRGGKSSFAKDAEACGRQTAGARDGVRQCISKLGFTYNCANCYADLVGCTISPKCINQCITGSNPACDACARQNCWPSFQGCTGFEVLQRRILL